MLPNVFIFEGGDICGKTTQVRIASESMKKTCTFKFPSRQIDIPKSEISKDYIEECFPLKEVYWTDTENHYRMDIYDIFKKLHENIYNKPIEEIMKNIDYIEKLIICDISANGYDKYSWVKNVYMNICQNKLYDNIIIDRFVDSGFVYNAKLPIDYIWSLHPSAEQSKILNKFEERIYKWNTKVTNFIENTIENVNLVCTKDISHNLVKASKFSDILYQDISGFGLFNDFENFVTYYFDNSEILYMKTKESINNSTVNREISDYDKNVKIRYLVKKEFNNLIDSMDLRYGHRIKVPTDLILSQTKTPEEFYKEMTKL